jgi:hypothetical protein
MIDESQQCVIAARDHGDVMSRDDNDRFDDRAAARHISSSSGAALFKRWGGTNDAMWWYYGIIVFRGEMMRLSAHHQSVSKDLTDSRTDVMLRKFELLLF